MVIVKWCENCDKTATEGKFCGECGKKLTERHIKFCPSCNRKYTSGHFCVDCGLKLVDDEEESDCLLHKCIKCNKTFEEGKFCPACGGVLKLNNSVDETKTTVKIIKSTLTQNNDQVYQKEEKILENIIAANSNNNALSHIKKDVNTNSTTKHSTSAEHQEEFKEEEKKSKSGIPTTSDDSEMSPTEGNANVDSTTKPSTSAEHQEEFKEEEKKSKSGIPITSDDSEMSHTEGDANVDSTTKPSTSAEHQEDSKEEEKKSKSVILTTSDDSEMSHTEGDANVDSTTKPSTSAEHQEEFKEEEKKSKSVIPTTSDDSEMSHTEGDANVDSTTKPSTSAEHQEEFKEEEKKSKSVIPTTSDDSEMSHTEGDANVDSTTKPSTSAEHQEEFKEEEKKSKSGIPTTSDDSEMSHTEGDANVDSTTKPSTSAEHQEEFKEEEKKSKSVIPTTSDDSEMSHTEGDANVDSTTKPSTSAEHQEEFKEEEKKSKSVIPTTSDDSEMSHTEGDANVDSTTKPSTSAEHQEEFKEEEKKSKSVIPTTSDDSEMSHTEGDANVDSTTKPSTSAEHQEEFKEEEKKSKSVIPTTSDDSEMSHTEGDANVDSTTKPSTSAEHQEEFKEEEKKSKSGIPTTSDDSEMSHTEGDANVDSTTKPSTSAEHQEEFKEEEKKSKSGIPTTSDDSEMSHTEGDANVDSTTKPSTSAEHQEEFKEEEKKSKSVIPTTSDDSEMSHTEGDANVDSTTKPSTSTAHQEESKEEEKKSKSVILTTSDDSEMSHTEGDANVDSTTKPSTSAEHQEEFKEEEKKSKSVIPTTSDDSEMSHTEGDANVDSTTKPSTSAEHQEEFKEEEKKSKSVIPTTSDDSEMSHTEGDANVDSTTKPSTSAEHQEEFKEEEKKSKSVIPTTSDDSEMSHTEGDANVDSTTKPSTSAEHQEEFKEEEKKSKSVIPTTSDDSEMSHTEGDANVDSTTKPSTSAEHQEEFKEEEKKSKSGIPTTSDDSEMSHTEGDANVDSTTKPFTSAEHQEEFKEEEKKSKSVIATNSYDSEKRHSNFLNNKNSILALPKDEDRVKERFTITFYVFILNETWKAFVDLKMEMYVFLGCRRMSFWKKPCVKMVIDDQLNDKRICGNYLLISGHLVIPKEYLKDSIEYKYVFMDEQQNKHFEILYNATETVDVYRNRLLEIPASLLESNSSYYQFDDTFWPMKPSSKTFFKSVKNYLFNSESKMKDEAKKIMPKLFSSYIQLIEYIACNSNDKVLCYLCLYFGFMDAKTRSNGFVLSWAKFKEKDQTRNKLIAVAEKQLVENMQVISVETNPREMKIKKFFSTLAIVCYIGPWILHCKDTFCVSLFKALSLEFTVVFDKDWNIVDEIRREFNDSLIRTIVYHLELLLYNVSNIKDFEDCIWRPLVLIHLLSGEVELFQQPQNVPNFQILNKENCGLSVLSKKYIPGNVLDFTFNNLDCLKHSMEMDKLMKTVMAFLMQPRHYRVVAKSELLNQRLVVNAMIKYIKNNNEGDVTDFASAIDVLLKKKIDRKIFDFEFDCKLVLDLMNLLQVSPHKIWISNKNAGYYNVLVNIILIVYKSLKNFVDKSTDSDAQKKHECLVSKVIENLSDFEKNIRENVMGKSRWNKFEMGAVFVEVELLQLLMHSFAGFKDLKPTMLFILRHKLSETYEKSEIEFIEIYSKLEMSSFSYEIQDVFQEICTNLLSTITAKPGSGAIFEHLTFRKGTLSVFCDFFLKEWQKKKEFEDRLNHCLTWPPMTSFLKIFGEHSVNTKIKEIIKVISNIIAIMMEHISNASITIGKIEILSAYQNTFFQLAQILIPKELKTFPSLGTKLQCCEKNLQVVKTSKNVMQYFLSLCQGLPDEMVDFAELHLKVRADLTNRSISGIYNEHDGVLSYYGVTVEFFTFMSRIYNIDLQKNSIFMRLYRNIITQFHREEDLHALNCQQFFDHVMRQAFNEIQIIVDKILCEEVSVELISRISNEETMQDIKKDLEMFKSFFDLQFTPKEVENCFHKIQCVLTIQKCHNTAEYILRIKKELELQVDFKIITDIIEKVKLGKSLKLKDIGVEITAVVKVLRDLKPEVLEIIKAIASNLNIMKWLKKEIKGAREVKVFIDLISAAAGEDEYDIGRVTCFEATCLAFRPMIFDLPLNSGFEEFLNACKEISKIFKTDPTILRKLSSSNHNISWYEQAKLSQGSLATNTLMQANSANRYGVYTIGNVLGRYRFIEEEATIEEVIQLKVANGHDDTTIATDRNGHDDTTIATDRVFNLFEIRDIQSRLMLLAGDITKYSSGENKQNEKDYFLKISEVAVRFARVFVALCEAGNIRWLHYRKTFRCDVQHAIDFGYDEHLREIQQRIDTLENDLEKWKNHLNDYRKSNPLLNHFTVKQCLVLQYHLYALTKDLASVQRIEPQVYTLLKAIALDIDTDMIKHAFMLSNIMPSLDSSAKAWMKADYKQPTNFNQHSYEELKNFVALLTDDHGIDKSVAMACLIKCFPFVLNKAIIWCGRHADSDMIDDLAEEAESKLDQLRPDEDEETGVEAMDYELDDMTEFEAPFLSLEQFGQFLKALKDSSKSIPKQIADQDLIRFLNQSKTSLLVFPKDEIYYSVLQLYFDYKNSLPLPEEILLCSDKTSLEQIQLLMLNAVYSNHGIYCLVFADALEYDIAEQAFMFLKSLMKEGATDRLIVYCSMENENRSYMCSALDSYRVKTPPHHQFGKRRKLEVHKKLETFLPSNSKTRSKVMNAAMVDPKRFNTRVIKSSRGGMGKTLYVTDKEKELRKLLMSSKETKEKMKRKARHGNAVLITTPVHGTVVNIDQIVSELLFYEEHVNSVFPRIYHFDLAPTVCEGVDNFVFNLAILGSIQTRNGKVWRRNDCDLCIIESTELTEKVDLNKTFSPSVMLPMLPNFICISPKETHAVLNKSKAESSDKIWNENQYLLPPMQRVCQYLSVYKENPEYVELFQYVEDEVLQDISLCLEVLLSYCGIPDPSWMELRNFVYFFDQQLKECERSDFTSDALRFELRGFKRFVLNFLLTMSKDFATRSLTDNTESQDMETEGLLCVKRKWEQSFHPYLFFNHDGSSVSFLGFNVDPECNLIDPDTNLPILDGTEIMSKDLYDDLMAQMQGDFMNLSTNYETLNRDQKLTLLRRVMGVCTNHDPDPTYELTIDNMKKILAIYLRLRCGIPVVLMGETGCGKTRLIRFMCELRAGNKDIRNMLLVKVHGGVTEQDIFKRINEAKKLAKLNKKEHKMSTILFLDEANTTDGIGLIKEIMIDKQIKGKTLDLKEVGLEIIAACNPYRKHSEEMVKKLESAGLGYHVNVASTYEKLGNIPLRQLVYRVHPLPESMKPLIWDFGQLNQVTELAYAKQIIHRYVKDKRLPNFNDFEEVLVQVLGASQAFMRGQEDECSFVSLRDVERAVQVTAWFYLKMNMFLKFIPEENTDEYDVVTTMFEASVDRLRQSLVLALAVCYVSRLEDRTSYIKYIIQYFVGSFQIVEGEKQFENEIWRCQKMFVNQLKLDDNIARNKALCENVFMMVICIELRIPLFVVGKPGSSKSLAKTIVQDNMQGKSSKSELFQHFKHIHMSSYQCSPMSTAESIIVLFKQSSRFQEGKDLNQFTSVVVLDEVGLAEDSPRMPLKALHPLLEDGTDGSEDLTFDQDQLMLQSKRVAFVGISNWALDPAKMNRGIMLCRSQPNLHELMKTAREICGTELKINLLIEPLAEAYLEIYEQQKTCEKLIKYKKEEFFGLRDFYSLIKMTLCFTKRCEGIPSLGNLEHAVRRNFSGFDGIDTWDIFKRKLIPVLEDPRATEQDAFGVNTLDLVKANFKQYCPCYFMRGSPENKKRCSNIRYLLIITEEFSALPIIEKMFCTNEDDVSVIFGSSFPKDQDFTQICRDINRIKMCMETGKTVVLLNMEILYESLYDALNQYYVQLGGENYVDLGLGTHRVKCKVHEDFKMIVIADKKTVYQKFPIPLINRLEKHYIVTSTSMNQEDTAIVNKLKEWAKCFSCVKSARKLFEERHAFVNFNEDTCAAIVVHLRQTGWDDPEEILHEAKLLLLKIATPDSIARLTKANLPEDEKSALRRAYFVEENHASMQKCLQKFCNSFYDVNCYYMQVTTFSRLLSNDEVSQLRFNQNEDYNDIHVQLISLMQFQTEQSFRDTLRMFFAKQPDEKALLIIQCRNSLETSNLVACAQHICKQIKAESWKGEYSVYVVFLQQLNQANSSVAGLSSSQLLWNCIHIDELREPDQSMPSFIQYAGLSISSLFDMMLKESDHDVIQVIQLVKGCVQSAIKNLNDFKTMTTEEITVKINVLNGLLDGTDGPSCKFVEVLFEIIKDHLKDKENQSLSEYVNDWVLQEAVEQQHLPDYGTFREALIRTVEDRITPVLTTVMKKIDQNNNLMILNQFQFLKQMWIELFTKLLKMKTNDILEESNQKDFTADFPFSFQLVDILEKTVKPHVNLENKVYDLLQITKVIDSLAIGDCIKDLDTRSIRDYIHDVVNIVFKSPTGDVSMVLEESLYVATVRVVKNANHQLDQKEKEDFQLDLSLAAVHVALLVYGERFQNTVAILQYKPDLVGTVLKKIQSDNYDEVIVDALAIQVALRDIVPSDNQINCQQNSFIWLIEVKQIRLLCNMIFNDFQKYPELFERHSSKILKFSSIMWTKLHILQLYIDNVCPPGVESNTEQRKTVIQLWDAVQILKDELESRDSWNIIESFLNDVLSKYNRTNERTGECIICKEVYNNPVTLPCHHRYCFGCITAVLHNKFCPMCNFEIPANFQASSKKLTKDDNKKIDDDILKNVVYCAFRSSNGRTKRLSPAEEYALDTTPTIRSFIIQQLLKRDKDSDAFINECLEEYLQMSNSKEDKWNICKMFIHCYEDRLTQDAAYLRSKEDVFIRHILNYMKDFVAYQENVNVDFNFIKNIASGRFAVTEIAKLLCKEYLPDVEKEKSKEMKQLFTFLYQLVSRQPNSDAHMFLLRQIIINHGDRELQMIVQKSQFDWLNLKVDKTKPSQTAQDKYLVYGKRYQDIREEITKLLMQKADNNTLKAFQEDFQDARMDNYYVRLSLSTILDTEEINVDSVVEVFKLEDWVTKLAAVNDVIRDNKNLKDLLIHFSLMLLWKGNNGLMSLHFSMMNNPVVMQGCYLPTMPSDNFDEVQVARPQSTNQNWVPHSCPNGHVYFITECGRASQQYNCNECGAAIGGSNHQLTHGNVKIDRRDLTRPGHALGTTNLPYPERSISPLSVVVQRILLHMSMLLGVLNGHHQDIYAIIQPRVLINNIPAFLQDHIRKDLLNLSKVFAKNADDVITLLHVLFQHIYSTVNGLEQFNMQTKQGRKEYEENFHKKVIETFLPIMENSLSSARKSLIGDTRIGSSKEMRRLYELDPVVVPEIEQFNILQCPPLWEYHQAISIDHFKHQLDQRFAVTQGRSLRMLSKFLQQDDVFQLLNDLPSIIQLQKILFLKLNYHLDKEIDKEKTICDVIKQFDKASQKLVKSLIRKLRVIWKVLTPLLQTYGKIKLEDEYPAEIDDKSRISYILCSQIGAGRKLFAIINYLAQQQNEFLDFCRIETGLKQEQREVSLLKITGSDIISYHSERDLLPLVYSHCDYTLEIGRGVKAEYDFQAIEKSLIENMYFGKARLLLQIPVFEYADDVRKCKKFLLLKESIEQKFIPHNVQHNMMLELRQIADVSNTLRGIEIAIGFLTKTTFGDPGHHYRKYLKEVLQMKVDEFIPSVTMQNTILLTHLSSAWLMLTVERAKRLQRSDQEPFPFVNEMFCVELNDELKIKLRLYLRHVETAALLSILTEYIVSELDQRNENDVEFELSEALQVYEDQKRAEKDGYGEIVPDDVQLKHVYSFWVLVVNEMDQR